MKIVFIMIQIEPTNLVVVVLVGVILKARLRENDRYSKGDKVCRKRDKKS